MQRLQTRPQFQAVLAGKVIAKTEHFALHRNRLDVVALSAPALFPVPDVWIGAMVPKRWAKRAVTRNAIKRQIYTVSADFLPHFLNHSDSAFLVRLRREFSRKEFTSATSVYLKEAVRAEVAALMQAGAAPSEAQP